MRAILLALCAIWGPALAAAPAAQVQNADFSADAALVEDAKSLARMTAGQRRGADKIVYLGRDASGETMVTGIGMGAPSVEAEARDSKTVAVVWIRPGNRAPSVDDRALAEHLGRCLFLYGESSGVMWEIARRGGVMQYRKIGSAGAEWQSWK